MADVSPPSGEPPASDPTPGAPPPPAIGASGVPLPPGYELVARLGSGGFATVWLAEQGRLGRRVAVKILGESLSDSERERRFVAECRAIGSLSGHPAVVTVHDAGTTSEGHPYLVMEHLPGGSLHDRVATTGPLPWEEVVSIGVAVGDALAAAHDAGILHRDVKPANVLVADDGSPKLGDFGIARLAEGTNTATGTLVGTIPFTPPEVLSGHRPGPTADIWALGATLYALVSGRSPFAGDRDEPPAATIARVLRSEAPPLPPNVPGDVAAVVADMLRADPADRPQTATAVVTRLQEVQRTHGLPVTRARATADSTPATPPPPSAGAAAVAAGFASSDGPASGPSDAPTVAESPATPPPLAATPTPVPGPPPPRMSPPTPPPPPRAGTTVHVAAAVPTPTPPPTPPPGAPGSVGPVGPGTPIPAGPDAQGGARSRRGPLLAAAALLVVVALVAGLIVALTRGGDDDTGDPTVAADTSGGDGEDDGSGDAAAPDPDSLVDAGTHVDTIWGTPLPLATGVSEPPISLNEAEREVDCGGSLTCAATAIEDDVVLAYPTDQADGPTVDLERASAVDGASVWGPVTIDTPPSAVALAWAGPNLLLATIEGEGDDALRAYRGIDPGSGEVLWTATYPSSDRPIRPSAQASQDVSVVMMTSVSPQNAAVGISNADGVELWEHEGRVLATDADAVYFAVGGKVVARDIQSGEQLWEADVPVDEDGSSPAGRLGAVRGGVLVTVSGGEIVGLDVGSGDEAWPARTPLSADGLDVGVAQAVAVAGAHVIVAAETGDVGVQPTSGELVWREVRAPFIVPEKTNLWIGTGDTLVVGQLGEVVRTIDPEDGASLTEVAVTGGGGRALSSNAIDDGIVLLIALGVRAYALDGLVPLWTWDDFGEARTVVAVSGGVVMLGSGGITWLRAPP